MVGKLEKVGRGGRGGNSGIGGNDSNWWGVNGKFDGNSSNIRLIFSFVLVFIWSEKISSEKRGSSWENGKLSGNLICGIWNFCGSTKPTWGVPPWWLLDDDEYELKWWKPLPFKSEILYAFTLLLLKRWKLRKLWEVFLHTVIRKFSYSEAILVYFVWK